MMDSLPGNSGYPPGLNRERIYTVLVRCAQGHTWEAGVVEEFGARDYETPEDRLCPECGEAVKEPP